MEILLINSSPQGSTKIFSDKFRDSAIALGANVETINLSEETVHPCKGCSACQNVEGIYCVQSDSAQKIAERILESDIFIFATPIYSWYSTVEIKALMDRLVYMMNKYYGRIEEKSLWQNKRCGLITTSGYNVQYGNEIFEEGFRRWCKHSRLAYKGICAVQAKNVEAEAHTLAEQFAQFLINQEEGIYSTFETINQVAKNKLISMDEVMDIATSGDILDKYPMHNKEYRRRKEAESKVKESVDPSVCKHKIVLQKGNTYKLFIPIAPKFNCKLCGSKVEMKKGYKGGLLVYKVIAAIITALLFSFSFPYLKESIVLSVLIFIIGWFFLVYIGNFVFSKVAKYKICHD